MKKSFTRFVCTLFVFCLAVFALASCDGVKLDFWNDNSDSSESAYDIAVKNGFVGTEAEWLESLKGSNHESCTHEGTISWYETNPHTLSGYDENGDPIFTDGVYLEYCTACNSFFNIIKNELRHTPEAEPREIEATCTSDSMKAVFCEVCGFAIENDPNYIPTPATGHLYGEYEWIRGNGDNICEGEGLFVAQCKYEGCGTYDYKFMSLNGHAIENWAIHGNNMDGTDVATGNCINCSMSISVLLPELSSDNTNYTFEYKDGKAPTLTDGAIEIWSYRIQAEDVLDGKILRYEHVIKEVYAVEVPPLEHETDLACE